jgi:hypothetical protein
LASKLFKIFIMKKLLLSFSLLVAVSATNAQNIITENFDNVGNPVVLPAGWQVTNQSAPVGTTVWFQGGGAATLFPGFNGGQTGYIGANFNATTGAGTISNWLNSPTLNLQQGDVISFYTRQPNYGVPPTPANTFPDRLEMRLSANGDFSVIPSAGINDVGDFTEVLVEVNPTLALTGYPEVWTQYTYTNTEVTPISGKIAFRYYVTNGGPTGANSNYIGIDAFSIDRPLSTDGFFAQNYKVWPNPASTVLNFANKATSTIESIQITDLNGRTIKEVKGMVEQINISELNAGLYFVKVTSNEGTGTTKIIKK